MFGKTPDINHDQGLSDAALDDFFGDGGPAEKAAELLELRDRLDQVESQISSQFTSLATYAQIALEQVELARSEAKATTARSEQRVTSLIERERADRLTSLVRESPAGSPAVTSRLDALEHSVAYMQKGLDECRRQQKEFALAITAMFDRLTGTIKPVGTALLAPPVVGESTTVGAGLLAPPCVDTCGEPSSHTPPLGR